MKGISLLRTAPVALWLALLAVVLVGTGYWTISSRIDAASVAADDVARDDAVAFADAAGTFAGYELTIPIADGTNLLASPLFASRSVDGCRAGVAPLGNGPVKAVVFYRGEVLCSIDGDTNGPLSGELLDWSTSWWAEKSASQHFEVHGSSGTGVGTLSAAPGGYLATGVPHEDLGLVAFVPLQTELQRHLGVLGDQAVAVGMLDRSGNLMAAANHAGPVDSAGEFMGDVDGTLTDGPGGVEARWAKGSFGQRFGALVIGVNPEPADEHVALFQSRSRWVAAGVGLFGLAMIGAVVLWGTRSLRRVAAMVEAAADGSASTFEAPRHAPAEVVRLSDTLSRLAKRRRVHDIERERARQAESAALGLELHDDIIQRLAAASLLSTIKPDAAAESLAETSVRIRNLSATLCPPPLAADGLAAAVAALDTPTLAVHVDDRTDATRFDAQVEGAVYRNVVEAIHNASMHGHASTVHVAIDVVDGELGVVVDDDGVGIDGSMVDGRPGHFGISSMRSLMHHIDGTAEVTATPSGTRVVLRCPARPSAAKRPATV